MRNFLARIRRTFWRLRYSIVHRALWQEIDYIERWLAENTEEALYDSQHIDYLDDEIAMLRDEVALVRAAVGVQTDPAKLNGKEISTGFVNEMFDQEW